MDLNQHGSLLVSRIAKKRPKHCIDFPFVQFKTLQPSVAFHKECSHLYCRAEQLTGFYRKLNTGLKKVKKRRC